MTAKMKKITSKMSGKGYAGVFWYVPAHLDKRGIEEHLKARGRTFWIDYRVKGKRYREKLGRENVRFNLGDGSRITLTEKRAFEIREKRRHERIMADDFKEHTVDLTMNAAWKDYLNWAKLNKKTWQNDRRLYKKRIQERFSTKTLGSISKELLEKFRNELQNTVGRQGKLLAPATVKHYLVLIRQIYNYMIRLGKYSGPNPVSSMRFKNVDNRITEVLTEEELHSLLKVLKEYPGRDAANLIQAAIFTGLRRGELFKLQWKHVHIDKAYIELESPKSGAATEKCFLAKPAINILKEQLQNRHSDFVFPGKNGKQRVEIKTAWNSIKKLAGITRPFRFHGLRHNFASQLAMKGVGAFELQAVMRHKNISTTERYIAITDEAQRSAVNRFAEIVRQ